MDSETRRETVSEAVSKAVSETPENRRILVFFTRDSVFGREVEKEMHHLQELLQSAGEWSIELIDIRRRPDLADRYKVDALPMVLVDRQRFIGKPSAQTLAETLLAKL